MFETNLRAALVEHAAYGDAESSFSQRCLDVLNGPHTIRRQLLLRSLEHHAALAVGQPADAIDWSQVNWAEILGVLLKILIIILPLL